MRPSPSHLLPLTLLPVLSGCPMDQSCTLLYAPDQVLIEFQADALATREWQVAVADEVCTITLPGAEADVVCPLDDLPLTLTLNDDGTAITEALLFGAGPASLSVEVSHDGVIVASETLSPTYELFEPNGAGCGESKAGTTVLDLDG